MEFLLPIVKRFCVILRKTKIYTSARQSNYIFTEMKQFLKGYKKGLKPLRQKERVILPSESDSDSDFVPEDMDSNDDNEDNEDTANDEVIVQLKDAGLETYLVSQLGNKTKVMAQTMLGRFCKFLIWFYMVVGGAVLVGPMNACQLVSMFILEQFQLLPSYLEHLRDVILLKASTIVNHNEGFQVLVDWYSVYRVCKVSFPVAITQLYGVNHVIATMRRVWGKERRVCEAESEENTVEGLIAARKWPSGGFKDLYDAVLGQVKWARKVCTLSSMEDSSYKHFMEFFISLMYTGMSVYI
jgi:hypothetical protein